MRYSFLDLAACPATGEPLVLVGAAERECKIAQPWCDAATRVSAAGATVGHVPESPNATPLHRLLRSQSAPAIDPARNYDVVISGGVLVEAASGRWYPIIDEVPEFLPDSIRDWQRDLGFLESIADRIPPSLLEIFRTLPARADKTFVPGDQYKKSEISLLEKIDVDPGSFLGPGYLSPFHPGAYHHSADLIRGFACCLPFLGIGQGDYVLDSGSGYSWTTEWFMKMGIHPVGLEISRIYLDVGRHRMGDVQPHLVVGDAENLPFQTGKFNAILGFDAFHHVANRETAMREFARVLTPRGRVVLVEPSTAHDHAPGSVEAMEKYGTLEHGMDLPDVQRYIADTRQFGPAREIFVNAILSDYGKDTLPTEDLKDRKFIGWSMFQIEKMLDEGSNAL